jgi:CheY-like chemotaxis protein
MAAEVLLVDGDRFFAHTIRAQLEAVGVTVAHELTGAEALDYVYEHQPRVVLVDVNLGQGLDGFGTAAAIRGRFEVPVIYMARTGVPADARETLRRRAAVVLPKPCSTGHLLAALERAQPGLLRHYVLPDGAAG